MSKLKNGDKEKKFISGAEAIDWASKIKPANFKSSEELRLINEITKDHMGSFTITVFFAFTVCPLKTT